MKLRYLLVTVRNLLFGLFFGWLVLSPVLENSLQMNYGYTILTTRVGGREEPTQSLAENKFFREMLKERFPDWYERVNYQNKQVEFYRSGLLKISAAKRVGMPNSFKLTPQEQDAFDYFEGKNFYSYHQNGRTPPNIYDTRQSFLLKMENTIMRDKFLKAYNRKKIRLPTEINS